MISVCMASYNGAKYIKEQIDSILAQLGAEDELIVSDDGSTDTTLDIIGAYSDNRIKLLTNNKRKGVVGNFENALKNAVGDYVFLADQDDVWLTDKVERCLQALQTADFVVHDAIVTDGDLNPTYDSFFALRGFRRGFWSNLLKNGYVGCCMAFRRSVMEYILPFPKKIAMHDIWIGLMVERKGTIAIIDNPYIYFRRHGDNASDTAGRSTLSALYKLEYRLRMLYEVVQRIRNYKPFSKKHR